MPPNGVWDVINYEIGAKSVPSKLATPWAIVTYTGTTVLVWSDGRVLINLTGGLVEDAEAVEALLGERFTLQKKVPAEYRRDSPKAAQRIRFGNLGEVAQEKADGRGFRYAPKHAGKGGRKAQWGQALLTEEREGGR